MENLSKIGRIFFGIAIAEIGLQSIYFLNLPYILQFPEHFPKPAHIALACIFGLIFLVAGICIIFSKNPRPVSLLFGGILLLIFCFYCIPYELLTSPTWWHFDEWENAEKELAFAGGALVIAGCFPPKNEGRLTKFLSKLIPLGAILFAITMVCFGILHFMLGAGAASYVPVWIPWRVFWVYFCGAALIGSGIAIIFKIKPQLFATLLGLMIFIWFTSLHVPRIIAAPTADIGDEITSACFALAYSGIAFVIAGRGKQTHLK
jgi:uncharacterized membrane protein YphA (DoxX/SURF4 family)